MSKWAKSVEEVILVQLKTSALRNTKMGQEKAQWMDSSKR